MKEDDAPRVGADRGDHPAHRCEAVLRDHLHIGVLGTQLSGQHACGEVVTLPDARRQYQDTPLH